VTASDHGVLVVGMEWLDCEIRSELGVIIHLSAIGQKLEDCACPLELLTLQHLSRRKFGDDL
jgi:hypothetical protein